MDIILKGKKPELDMPYFGRQSRFFEFFDKCITPLMSKNGIYAETNSGSNSNIYMFAKKGYRVIANDVSLYSNSIAMAVMSNEKPKNIQLSNNWLDDYKKTYIDRAALFAGLIDKYGYNPQIPKEIDDDLKQRIDNYKENLKNIKEKSVSAYKIFNLDLFDYLKKLEEEKIIVDVMFMDFAWPWRDGNLTNEYDTTANTFSDVLNEKRKKVKIWDKNNVIEEVIKAVNQAKKVSRFVLLSNQSSNYPTPEILEIELLKNGIEYEERHTMLTDAEYEDDLGKEKFFREYLYVIRGINE